MPPGNDEKKPDPPQSDATVADARSETPATREIGAPSVTIERRSASAEASAQAPVSDAEEDEDDDEEPVLLDAPIPKSVTETIPLSSTQIQKLTRAERRE